MGVEGNIIYKDCRHAQSDPARRLVHSLHSKLKSAFAFHPSNTIHIDGSPSLQKSRARQSRTAQKAKQEQALSGCYEEFEVLAATTNNESQSSRTRRRLIKLIKQARERWKKARVIDTTTREQIAKGLESLGWVVCRCKGEADICVRQKASETPETVVASTDSDYLFHGVKRLLKKDSRTHKFTSYDVDNIIQHLGVSRDQWALAAVVTNNDYSKQVRGQTFSKNIVAVRDCDKNDRSLALNQYCARFGVDATWFSQATGIFFDGIETLMEASTSNDHIDTMFKEMANSTTICLQQMKRQRSESPSTKHSYYVPKGVPQSTTTTVKPGPETSKERKKKRKRKGRRKTTKSEKKVVLRLSTIVDHDLRKNHPVKSLTIGSPSACLKKQGVAPDDANIMQKQLRLGVDFTNQLQQRAYFACALLIPHLLQDPSSPSSLLDRVIDNQTFIFGLARLLYFGRPKKAPAK
ncbi:hypothetical protein B0O80DRAFT_497583 [Mortierella sp. GBAus27b]|nr:hypothetical protein B0O80DRAFT_497583 [Mortierella sp. GBAus27b]